MSNETPGGRPDDSLNPNPDNPNADAAATEPLSAADAVDTTPLPAAVPAGEAGVTAPLGATPVAGIDGTPIATAPVAAGVGADAEPARSSLAPWLLSGLAAAIVVALALLLIPRLLDDTGQSGPLPVTTPSITPSAPPAPAEEDTGGQTDDGTVTDPAPVDPAPVEPAPSEPAPEPTATEPPAEPEPTEPAPTPTPTP